MTALLFATRNRHKLREVAEILAGTRYSVDGLDGFPGAPEVDEDGDTFRANADKKARTLAAWSGRVCVADDSGLEVDALSGRPGVYSARYAGVSGPGADEANNERLLEELSGVPDSRRTARYRCALAIVTPTGASRYSDGTCEGVIGRLRRGAGGFGYDPLFVVGDGRTMAELSADEKHAISHRGRALRALLPLLETLFV